MSERTDFLWECLPDIADLKFYIEKEDGVIADEPAFIVYNHKLYLYKVGEIGSFRFRSHVLKRVKELVAAANYPLRLWASRHPRKGSKPFAENTRHKIPVNAVEGAPIKAFNIKEWHRPEVK